MPLRYALALYGTVCLLVTLDARLHGRSAPQPPTDACAASRVADGRSSAHAGCPTTADGVDGERDRDEATAGEERGEVPRRGG